MNLKISRRARLSAFSLGLVAVAGVAGLSGLVAPAVSAPSSAPVLDAQDHKVIDRLELLLRKRIKNPNGGPISLKLTPTSRASEGYFSDIAISGKPAKLKNLYVSEFSLHATNVQIDVPSLWAPKKVRTKSAKTQLRAVISQDDLTHMLADGKHTGDMNLKVKFQGNTLLVTGNLNYMLINGPVVGRGQLRKTADHKVYLDILSLKLRGVEVPAFIKNRFSTSINPVIDYEALPFNPPFKTLKVVGDKAYLST